MGRASDLGIKSLPTSWGQQSGLLVIDQPETELRVSGLPRQHHPPALSLLRQFSAPVKLEMGRPAAELVHLLAHDSDPVARWDAGQLLLRRALLARSQGHPDNQLEEERGDALGGILAVPSLSQPSLAAMPALRGVGKLEDSARNQRVARKQSAAFAVGQTLRTRLGKHLSVAG